MQLNSTLEAKKHFSLYVPIVMGSDVRIIPEVPALEYCSKEEEEEGKERYELQKRARLDKEEHFQEVYVKL